VASVHRVDADDIRQADCRDLVKYQEASQNHERDSNQNRLIHIICCKGCMKKWKLRQLPFGAVFGCVYILLYEFYTNDAKQKICDLNNTIMGIGLYRKLII
jgi:hypothetical protein